MATAPSISKNPLLSPGADYAHLRSEGQRYIEELGSAYWTDYNIHDPGITILELICYAITDLSYRASFDVKDLLAKPSGQVQDHERQAFFTARKILTINPWTSLDYRKLVIDIEGVKNAWIKCRPCPCDDIFLYADCKKSILKYEASEHVVSIKGLYDLSVEFDDEQGLGDLNSGKMKHNFSFDADGKTTQATLEMRLPSWQKLISSSPLYDGLLDINTALKDVHVEFISGNTTDDVNIDDADLYNALRKSLYATVLVSYLPDKADPTIIKNLLFSDVPVKILFHSEGDKKFLRLADISKAIADNSSSGILSRYLSKIQKAAEVMALVKLSLHGHRNLAEDFCNITAVPIEEIGICADIDVSPTADIEAVLAQAYFLIAQYINPAVKFYSLRELMSQKIPVESIFDGPPLKNGFILNEQLESTNLKEDLFSSDIINLLMDIPGITAIRNFAITRFDAKGILVESRPWDLKIKSGHLPRLYIEGSKFLVFKNGLPFLPDRQELADSLQVLFGENDHPAYFLEDNDLAVPEGNYYELGQYYPLQYSLPLTYGTGEAGLPSTASTQRKAEAKQLKAYLLFFEQFLYDYVTQLLHAGDFFAVDQQVDRTYFTSMIDENLISGSGQLNAAGFTPALLQGLAENEVTFMDRRNRFLDQLLSRFAEQFADYAAMLYTFSSNTAVAMETLVKDKISFIKDIPLMTSDRARSFNYKLPGEVCEETNQAGLATRIRRLLGLKDLEEHFEIVHTSGSAASSWQYRGDDGEVYFTSNATFPGDDPSEIQNSISLAAISLSDQSKYIVKDKSGFILELVDADGEPLGSSAHHFDTAEEAEAHRDLLVKMVSSILESVKIHIVEHLLLRPRNRPGGVIPGGDPLLSICIPPDCALCGQEDPYSFRITMVMNGEAGIANQRIEFRRFAEHTIRMEVPAHLGVKICWIDTKHMALFEEKYCAWLKELAGEKISATDLSTALKNFLEVFQDLKSVYPPASLHDCVDGDDNNRTFLGQTII